jgi:xanthine/uracil permease
MVVYKPHSSYMSGHNANLTKIAVIIFSASVLVIFSYLSYLAWLTAQNYAVLLPVVFGAVLFVVLVLFSFSHSKPYKKMKKFRVKLKNRRS